MVYNWSKYVKLTVLIIAVKYSKTVLKNTP